MKIRKALRNRCSQRLLLKMQNLARRLVFTERTVKDCATNSAPKPVLRDTNWLHQREPAVAAYLTFNQPALDLWTESHLQRRTEKSGFKENAHTVNAKREKPHAERSALYRHAQRAIC